MILVTGASGFLGRHVVRRLLGSGEAVRCLCRPGRRRRLAEVPAGGVVWGYLHDPDGVERAFRGVRHIIHLASPIREVRDAAVEQFHQRAIHCLVAAPGEPAWIGS